MPTVMIAVDGHEESCHIARAAARCFGDDATYLAIHVEDWSLTIGWPWGAAGVTPGHGISVGGYPATVVTADAAAAEAQEIARESGLDATPIGALGNPVTAIVQAATDHDVDVIVAGWHHRNWLQRLFTQATPEALLESSTIPIIFVPTSSFETERETATGRETAPTHDWGADDSAADVSSAV